MWINRLANKLVINSIDGHWLAETQENNEIRSGKDHMEDLSRIE